MKVVRFDQLIPQILIRIPSGCSSSLILDAIRSCAGSFCSETEIWREELTAQNLVAGQKAYSITPGYTAGIKRVYSANVRSAAEVTAGSKGASLDLDKASFSPRTDIITFDTAPSAVSITNGLVFTVILIPEFKSNEIAAWIIDRWSDGIIAGAVSEICGRPGPTFNQVIWERAAGDYRNAKADAMREAMADFKEGTLQFQPGWRLI